MELMEAIATAPGIGPYLPYIALLVALCSALAPMVPPSAGWLYLVVNFVALNMGHARNAGDVRDAASKPPANQL